MNFSDKTMPIALLINNVSMAKKSIDGLVFLIFLKNNQVGKNFITIAINRIANNSGAKFGFKINGIALEILSKFTSLVSKNRAMKTSKINSEAMEFRQK